MRETGGGIEWIGQNIVGQRTGRSPIAVLSPARLVPVGAL